MSVGIPYGSFLPKRCSPGTYGSSITRLAELMTGIVAEAPYTKIADEE